MNAKTLRQTLLAAIASASLAACGQAPDVCVDDPACNGSLDPAPEGTENISCTPAVEGNCPASNEVDGYEVAAAIGFDKLGSGDCLSGIYGPYARPSDATTPGACCFEVRIEGCEGRPFVVAGAARLATATERKDWI